MLRAWLMPVLFFGIHSTANTQIIDRFAMVEIDGEVHLCLDFYAPFIYSDYSDTRVKRVRFKSFEDKDEVHIYFNRPRSMNLLGIYYGRADTTIHLAREDMTKPLKVSIVLDSVATVLKYPRLPKEFVNISVGEPTTYDSIFLTRKEMGMLLDFKVSKEDWVHLINSTPKRQINWKNTMHLSKQTPKITGRLLLSDGAGNFLRNFPKCKRKLNFENLNPGPYKIFIPTAGGVLGQVVTVYEDVNNIRGGTYRKFW